MKQVMYVQTGLTTSLKFASAMVIMQVMIVADASLDIMGPIVVKSKSFLVDQSEN